MIGGDCGFASSRVAGDQGDVSERDAAGPKPASWLCFDVEEIREVGAGSGDEWGHGNGLGERIDPLERGGVALWGNWGCSPHRRGSSKFQVPIDKFQGDWLIGLPGTAFGSRNGRKMGQQSFGEYGIVPRFWRRELF